MTFDQQSGRKLGAIEKFFWLNDQNRSNHFAIAAELDGQYSVDAWSDCLNRHFLQLPHARDKIIQGVSGDAWFAPSGAEIDLRVIASGEFAVPHVLAEEINRPFDANEGPLMRAVLLQGSQKSVIVLSAHHAIADGMSLTFVLRDLLLDLAGELVAFIDGDVSLEQRLRAGSPAPVMAVGKGSPPTRPPVAFRQADARAAIDLESLSEDESQTLLLAARAQGTTVQGALSAAVAHVLTQNLKPSDGGSLRILVPLDARKRLLDGTSISAFSSQAPSSPTLADLTIYGTGPAASTPRSNRSRAATAQPQQLTLWRA